MPLPSLVPRDRHDDHGLAREVLLASRRATGKDIFAAHEGGIASCGTAAHTPEGIASRTPE